MAFFGSSKRKFDYEDALSSYTSSDGPDHLDGPRHKRPALSKGPSPFSQEKLGYYQQEMEVCNTEFKELIQKCTSKEEAVKISCEYLRVVKDITDAYQRHQGDAMAMGSDDTEALGVKIDASEAGDVLEYPPTFVRIPEDEKIIQVSAGGIHSAFLTAEGEVWSCGANDEYALGRPTDDTTLYQVKKVTEFPSWAKGRVVQVAAGDNHTIFLTIDGRVLVCGTYKDLDSAKFVNTKPGEKLKKDLKQPTPIEIPFPKRVRKIVAGMNCNAAILEDGSLYTWGMGHCGELARSESMGAPIKRNAEGQDLPDLGKSFIGEEYTEQTKNEKGEMETTTKYRFHLDLISKKFLTPAPVEFEAPGNYEVLDASIGEVHLLVVARKDGITKVYSAGHNNYGQLGHGDRLQRHKLTAIRALDDDHIVQVAAGQFHSLFRTFDRRVVFGCGRSDYGQLGLYDVKEKEAGGYKAVPERVPFPRTVEEVPFAHISAGGNNSAVILDNQDCYTWGQNISSQSGHPYKDREDKSEDIERPRLINPMRAYWKKSELGSTAAVLDIAFGGQHGLIVVKRYI